MTLFGRTLTQREQSLAVATGFVILCTVAWRVVLLPTWDRWQEKRAAWITANVEHATLIRHLDAADAVTAQMAALEDACFSDATDQITLARFLKRIETLQGRVVLGNMQSLPIESGRHHRRYPVFLTLAGRLVDIVRFVDTVTHGPAPVGVDSFTLRGVRAGHGVECALRVWMVRIDDLARDGGGDQRQALHRRGDE